MFSYLFVQNYILPTRVKILITLALINNQFHKKKKKITVSSQAVIGFKPHVYNII